MNLRSRIVRSITAALAALGLVAASAVVTATPAAASATWCSYTSQVVVGGVTIPTGQYCFSVIGNGTWVDFTSGSFNGPIIINAVERVTFFDRYGNSYASWITYSAPGNTYGFRYWRSGITGHARAGGSACGELLSSGVSLRRICHRIA